MKAQKSINLDVELWKILREVSDERKCSLSVLIEEMLWERCRSQESEWYLLKKMAEQDCRELLTSEYETVPKLIRGRLK